MKHGLKNTLYVLIGAMLAAVALFPIYLLIVNSIKTREGMMVDPLGIPNAENFSATNYVNAADRMHFFRAFGNSLFITIVSTILIVVISSMAAWALVRNRSKTSLFFYLLFAASLLIPFQCAMLPLVHMLFGTIGLNPLSLILCYMGFGCGISLLLYHRFMRRIPIEVEEAAKIDGCGMFRLYWRIVFPQLSPITITVCILNIIWIWNDFLLPSLLIGANPNWQTLPLRTLDFFVFSNRWDLAAAALILSILPTAIFYLFAQKKMMRESIRSIAK